jgi:small subunit ribosomal protein S16
VPDVLAPTRRQKLFLTPGSLTGCNTNEFGEKKVMTVRIRMKKMGRTHRPYYRVCAMDKRSPRDGRVIEELGTYDPMCPETDARVTLKSDRIAYWLGVGAQPSDKVATLIKKYGSEGTHLEQQKAALERLGRRKEYAPAPEPAKAEPAKAEPAKADKKKKEEAKAEAASEEAVAEETPAVEAAKER